QRGDRRPAQQLAATLLVECAAKAAKPGGWHAARRISPRPDDPIEQRPELLDSRANVGVEVVGIASSLAGYWALRRLTKAWPSQNNSRRLGWRWACWRPFRNRPIRSATLRRAVVRAVGFRVIAGRDT